MAAPRHEAPKMGGDPLLIDPMQSVPPMPPVDENNPDEASVAYSKHRTRMSEHRTALSEHRTDLSTNRTDMSSRRTGMSFQRTRMSADRTLMSIIRTSLSLISFGFTIYQGFEKLREAGSISSAAAPRNFGITLVFIGVALLIAGIIYHVQFMLGLRHERRSMRSSGMIHGESVYPLSATLVAAIVLLAVGIVAIISLVFHTWPFG
jgi:uncharacterized membrane protein YidH (DUF202 family)